MRHASLTDFGLRKCRSRQHQGFSRWPLAKALKTVPTGPLHKADSHVDECPRSLS